MQYTNGRKITAQEFKGMHRSDLFFITDEQELRQFERFAKCFTKRGEMKVVNTLGKVNAVEDMRWPTRAEYNEYYGKDVEVKSDGKVYYTGSDKKEDVKMGAMSTVVSREVAMVKSDSVDALYRVAAKQSIKNAKLPLQAFLAKQNLPSSALALVGAVLDTPNGEAVLALLLGTAMGHVPYFAQDAKMARLGKELRVLGMDNFFSQVADALLSPLREAFVEVVKQIPF